MPVVRVDILEGKSALYKQGILDGIHQALRECLQIPEHDRMQRIFELAAENFEVPAGRSDRTTLIEIKLFAGRTGDAKRNLYRRIVENLAANPGIDGTDITIILTEIPMINWGIRGGQAASDVDLGFKVVI